MEYISGMKWSIVCLYQRKCIEKNKEKEEEDYFKNMLSQNITFD